MNCSREVTTSFELGLGLRLEISVIGYDSSFNHPTRSKFEQGEGTGLNILEVATRLTSVRGWIDVSWSRAGQKVTTTDAPSALFSLKKVENSPSRDFRLSRFQVIGVSNAERGEE